jgi:hypothetical protein
MWLRVDIGRHRGKTLPQIMFIDPDWVYWADESNAFRHNRLLQEQACDVAAKAANIKIPSFITGAPPVTLAVEYVVDPLTELFSSMEIVPADLSLEGQTSLRSDRIDLSFPRRQKHFDKLGGKLILRDLRRLLLGSARRHMTKRRCEAFFDNPANFLSPGAATLPALVAPTPFCTGTCPGCCVRWNGL